MKSYTTKSNAIRAAKQSLGKEAVEGTHFTIADKEEGKFGFEEIIKEEAPQAAPIRHKSTVEKPTKRVWTIAKSMPGAKRKAILAACEEAGINKTTARTQYQLFKKDQQSKIEDKPLNLDVNQQNTK